jgi:hypothetical protein
LAVFVEMYEVFEKCDDSYDNCCKETFREYSSYVWDEKAIERGEDKPVEQDDYQLDVDRYFVNTALFRNKVRAVPFLYW